ncbi:paraquat-inducible protein A [Thalassotalea atypica]|uniref:paraquat-inducible protein A n=1 Tax=Thalassotalea atypica TaxID=2054316 RepID=UPI002574258F|nr:paraquat-inducible protein A [Thalassotalea atypica]
MGSRQVIDNFNVCHLCDGLSITPAIKPGQKALCPQCNSTVYECKHNPIERTLAISLAGMLLYIPTLMLPIIGIGAAGIYNNASLFDCIALMINQGFYVIAFSLFMFTLAIPLVRLFSAFYISFAIYRKKVTPSLFVFFRSYHILDSWAMIHVFFFGIVVSMYKLVELADLSLEGGLLSLILLLLCSTLISVTMDHHHFWEHMEQALDD